MRGSRGSRVIQVFPKWPARFGTVLEVNPEVSPTTMLVGWDDGRKDWIEEEEIASLGIWFVVDEQRKREPRPGPLELQLARFMAKEKS